MYETDFDARDIKFGKLFAGIRAMSYEFLCRGGVAHKMDSNFS